MRVHGRKECAGAFWWQEQTANTKTDVLGEIPISSKCWIGRCRSVASHWGAQFLGACSNLLSTALIKTIIEGNFERNEFIWLTLSYS